VDLGNGTAGVVNGFAPSGILITNAHDNVIGGTAFGARNVISGNGGNGITIVAANPPFQGPPVGPTDNNRVEGNFIGTQVDGVSPLGNDGNGVFLGFFGGISNKNNTIG